MKTPKTKLAKNSKNARKGGSQKRQAEKRTRPQAKRAEPATRVREATRRPHAQEKAAGAESQNRIEEIEKKMQKRQQKTRKEIIANLNSPEQIKAAIAQLSANEQVVSYLKRNVSRRVLDVIDLLTTPKEAEEIALSLDMKINAVRRILNMMQDYGITNYYVAKNVNGWLSFAWYMNIDKFGNLYEYVSNIENKRPVLSDQCNDYYICNNCYDKTKLIQTFDSAFEAGFKCRTCNDQLNMIDRVNAANLIAVDEQQARQRQ